MIKNKKYKSRKLGLILLVLIATIALLVSTSSATINPDYVSQTMFPGDCFTITKTVTIPDYTPTADVVFAFDLTGSMSGIINTAKVQSTNIMNMLITNYPTVSFNFGVMSYMDYPDTYSSCGYTATYGSSSSGDYAYSLDQPLTSSTSAVSTAINGLSLGYGGDGPQDYTRIFYESYADSNVGWRTGAKRLLVNFGDNVPHDCDLNQGVPGTSGTLSTGKDPGRDEIVNNADDLDLQSVLATMASNGVTLLECHTTTAYNNYWTYWTGLTGGNVYITSSGTLVNDVVAAIVSGITIPTIANLHLAVTTPGYGPWLSSVVPPSYANVNPGDTVTFQETICVPLGTPCGFHTFTVSAIDAQGVSYGDQIVEITIPCDTIPPVTTKIHGSNCVYYDDFEDVWYMKPCTPIYLYARDDHPDATGVEYLTYEIWWDQDCDGRYDMITEAGTIFDNDPFDSNPINGEIDIELHINEECCHMLMWYAVDIAGNQEEPHYQFYRLDATPPIITKTHPDPCYYPINQTAGVIKIGDRIILETEDQGIFPCIAGVENTFYRYEYEGISYPQPGEPGAISGLDLGIIYGYSEPEIIEYWWYLDDEYVEISFDETCKHTLYYWAKDNACNKGPIHKQIYWVNDCQDEVWIDASFGFHTPGWWHTHFRIKQMALDWLAPGGTAYVYEGVYDEDIHIDDMPCCDNTGITQMGEYGCFPLNKSALIKGSETIHVDDVTIKYLEYMPNDDGSIIIQEGVSGTTLRCNKFRQDCNQNAIGVKSLSSSETNAELNWWGRPTGPQGGKMDDGAIADGLGVHVIGNVDVEPWIGIHAEITKPVWSMIANPIVYVHTGEPVMFDASESWAYTYGECCQEPKLLPLQYLWNFDDGSMSANKVTSHVFNEPGIYEVSLMIDSEGIPGLYPNFMYDWANVTVHVTENDEEPLIAKIGSGELDQMQTIMKEPVSFSGSAYGGKAPYQYQWEFGDGTNSKEQFPIHTYGYLGNYVLTLSVTDANGDQAVDTLFIGVVEEINDDDIIEEVEITNVHGLYLLSATVNSDNQVSWSINLNGNVFFGGHTSGIAKGSTTIKLPFSIGLGPVDIAITAGSTQKQYTAFMLGPFLFNIVET